MLLEDDDDDLGTRAVRQSSEAVDERGMLIQDFQGCGPLGESLEIIPNSEHQMKGAMRVSSPNSQMNTMRR